MGKAFEDFKRSELVKAAKEVDELGFDTHPNLKGKPDEIRGWLKEAWRFLDEEDFEDLSPETVEVLQAIGQEEDEGESDEKGDPDETEEENDNEGKDNEEEEPVEKETPKKTAKKKAPAKATKTAKKETPAKADTGTDEKTPEQLKAMILARGKLADLKALVNEEPAFKKLRKRLDEFSGMQGPRQLKAEMEKCLPKVKADKADTGPAEKKALKSTSVKKSKATGKKKTNSIMGPYGWRENSLCGKTAAWVMEGLSEKQIISKIIKEFDREESVAVLRYKSAKRELVQRGFNLPK